MDIELTPAELIYQLAGAKVRRVQTLRKDGGLDLAIAFVWLIKPHPLDLKAKRKRIYPIRDAGGRITWYRFRR